MAKEEDHTRNRMTAGILNYFSSWYSVILHIVLVLLFINFVSLNHVEFFKSLEGIHWCLVIIVSIAGSKINEDNEPLTDFIIFNWIIFALGTGLLALIKQFVLPSSISTSKLLIYAVIITLCILMRINARMVNIKAQ